MKRYLVVIFIAVMSPWAHSQAVSFVDSEVMSYSFDGCDYADDSGLHSDLLGSNMNCVCGVVDQGIEFNSAADRLVMPLSINDFFNRDFTLSFYMQIGNNTTPAAIMTLRKGISVDSFFNIKYLPVQQTVSVQMAETPASFLDLSADLDTDQCWNHVVLTKQGRTYLLYVNGELKDDILSSKELQFRQDTTIIIASDQGSNIGEETFNGSLDEIELFSTSAGASDIQAYYRRPDQILTQDTTIFLGDVVPITMGPSCADIIQWQPADGLSDDTILEPTATPEVSTIYSVRLANTSCIINDTLRINVINRDSLDCEGLLLPTAFTPNGDMLNDRYGISNGFIVDDLKRFEIYDRWGQKVFETSDKAISWDGSIGGNQINPGMYVYKIEYSCLGNDYSISNSFSVLR